VVECKIGKSGLNPLCSRDGLSGESVSCEDPMEADESATVSVSSSTCSSERPDGSPHSKQPPDRRPSPWGGDCSPISWRDRRSSNQRPPAGEAFSRPKSSSYFNDPVHSASQITSAQPNKVAPCSRPLPNSLRLRNAPRQSNYHAPVSHSVRRFDATQLRLVASRAPRRGQDGRRRTSVAHRKPWLLPLPRQFPESSGPWSSADLSPFDYHTENNPRQ
jgi:hypothetical protein